MAKTSGPLLSFGALGTIGQTITFSKWKGRPYARQRVIPANPQTTAQTRVRDAFRNLNSIWKLADTLLVSPWDLFATGQVLTGRNAFIGQNQRILLPESDMLKMIGSPGAKGGLPPVSIIVTPGVGELTVDFTNPALPPGWTLDSAVATAIVDGDIATITDFVTVTAEDAVTQNSVDLTGLDTVAYSVMAWLAWTKPDGTKAYGASLNGTGTPT